MAVSPLRGLSRDPASTMAAAHSAVTKQFPLQRLESRLHQSLISSADLKQSSEKKRVQPDQNHRFKKVTGWVRGNQAALENET